VLTAAKMAREAEESLAHRQVIAPPNYLNQPET